MKRESYLKMILWRYALLFVFACALTWIFTDSAHCQVSPFMGIGNVQFDDNNGKPLTAGVLYSYLAGTTTQQATFTDFTGIIQNPNPIPFGSGARVSIWLTSGAVYKFVLCAQNDGPTCAPADVLFSQDQVPGSASGGGVGGGSPFISGSANPATSGILRLASGDAICWRNAAGTANLCITKDTSDVLAWAGGVIKLPETTCSSTGAGFDYLCADNTAHRLKEAGNGGSQVVLAAQGQDINASDFVTQLHFGSTATPISGTAPTTGQFLEWNGTAIIGAGAINLAATADQTAQGANIGSTALFTTPASNGAYNFWCYVVLTRAATTSSTLPQCQVLFTDADSSTSETIPVTGQITANTVGSFSNTNPSSLESTGTIFVKASTVISYATTAYASSGATSMQYAIHVRLQGPF